MPVAPSSAGSAARPVARPAGRDRAHEAPASTFSNPASAKRRSTRARRRRFSRRELPLAGCARSSMPDHVLHDEGLLDEVRAPRGAWPRARSPASRSPSSRPRASSGVHLREDRHQVEPVEVGEPHVGEDGVDAPSAKRSTPVPAGGASTASKPAARQALGRARGAGTPRRRSRGPVRGAAMCRPWDTYYASAGPDRSGNRSPGYTRGPGTRRSPRARGYASAARSRASGSRTVNRAPPSGAVAHLDAAPVALHDPVGDEEAEAGPLPTPREEGLEDPVAVLRVDAGAGVAHLEQRAAVLDRAGATTIRSPSSTACNALVTRFRTTWWSWPSSPSTTGGRRASRTSSIRR